MYDDLFIRLVANRHQQSVMCHGDLTLEPPLYVTEESFGGPTGWGIAHQCRDWDTMHNIFAQHQITFSAKGEPILWSGPLGSK